MSKYQIEVVTETLFEQYTDLVQENVGQYVLLNLEEGTVLGVFDSEEEAIEAEALAELYDDNEEE